MREQLKYSFILNLTMGFCLSMFAGAISAASTPNTITIDVNNPAADVNYNEVDKFIEAQDTSKSIKGNKQYAAMDGKTLIISDQPIILTSKTEYNPRLLSDLGLKLKTDMDTAVIAKAAPYMLASRNLASLPSVPEMNLQAQPVESIVAEFPVQFALTTLGQIATLVTTVIAAPEQNSPEVAVLPPSTKVFRTAASTPEIALKSQSSVHSMSASMLSGVSQQYTSTIISLALAGLALLTIYGLTRLRSRKSTHQMRQLIYSGQIADATDMIGKGEMFDFNNHLNNGQIIPMNTTYLNMLWKVGKFSNDGAVDTYFYMAYYIPSMRAYAATLKSKKTETRQKTDA